mgnify:CR=1 FL=1
MKRDGSGVVCYEPANHERMTRLRAEMFLRIAGFLPPMTALGPERGELLVLGWGSTYGDIRTAAERARARGLSVASAQLRYLNQLPDDLGDLLGRYERVLVPELNSGQLRLVLRARYLLDIEGLNKVQGQPFRTWEIEQKILEMLGEPANAEHAATGKTRAVGGGLST